ncbi:MAG: hypothetical protein LBQ66_08015 [Planctomycetaceae bacterium]|nr:hypothetical protein [Planctomycetaceae bacterium]
MIQNDEQLTAERNTHLNFYRPKPKNVDVVGARLALVPKRRKTHRQRKVVNRPAVGYPPYVCRHVLAFLPNLFGFLMHLGGRDARVPVRFRFAEFFLLAAQRRTYVV